jgi:phosphoserine phosphatase RsbU/P
VAGAPQPLPDGLAQAFGAPMGRVWPLRVRGDLLGALVTEDLPRGSRRQSILDGIAHQLAMAMESARLARDLAEQQRLENELEVARDIQASFLPKECPHVAGWEVDAFWHAARQVGGDFYDFIPLQVVSDEPLWGIVMADVAGKGVPAALFMAMSRTILRSVAINRVSPAATLMRVNQLIVTEARSELFVSVFYGVWRPHSGRFVYANAGHNAPLWVNGQGEVRPLAGRGVVLGAMDDAQYTEAEIHLQPGEMLLLYTDGLTEAINSAEEEFGGERVRGLLHSAWQADASAQSTLERLAGAVQAFSGPTGMFDDVTMALIKRTAAKAPGA